jgi:hypothetical protein
MAGEQHGHSMLCVNRPYVDHFLEFSHFMTRCLKYKHKAKADMETNKEVYEGMQKKAKQSKITAFNQEYGRHSSECQHKCLCVY